MRMPLPETSPTLVYDRTPAAERAAMSFFRMTGRRDRLGDGCDPSGLDELHLSGSERLSSVEQVHRIQEAAGDLPVFVLDLRQEPHAVVGDYPVTERGPRDWAHVDLTSDQAAAADVDLAERLACQPSITVTHADFVKGKSDDPRMVTLHEQTVRTERQVVELAGAAYRRIAVTDHLRPARHAVDEFIELVRSMPQRSHLHVHCNGGRGRTTTFMCLYDMLRNARRVDASAIIERQSRLGFDYPMTTVRMDKPEKMPFQQDRLDFLHEFHRYAQANPGGQPKTWSQWREQPQATDQAVNQTAARSEPRPPA